ncbi:MAG: isopentenyl phosphate kinase [Microgenomates group bacterium]
MKDLILIKLGGSLITDKNKPYTPRPRVISRLAKEIKKALDLGIKIIVSHGSGSFGHTLASKYGTADGIKRKKDVYGLCLVQQDAIAINRIVNQIFLQNKISCLSFVPSSFSFAQNKKLKAIFVEPIVAALKLNIIPIVFGDIILDEKLGCCIFSGEVTLDNLSEGLQKRGFKTRKVIQCGTTDGVYDEKGQTIPLITPKNFEKIKKALGGAAGTDVTGGMLHKVEESLKMARLGIVVYIINGKIKDNLYKAIVSRPKFGTLITYEGTTVNFS